MTDAPATHPETDLIVVGSGAAGLSAAVTAAARGLRVTVIEKAPVLGGTTAWSGGWIWAPRNPVVRRAGIEEPEDAPRRYVQSVLGNHFDPDRVDAFLAAAPEMVGFFEEHTALRFEGGLAIPDTYGDRPGAGTGGRSVIAAPYDARGLGEAVKLLREPVRETTFFGMTIQAGPDLRAFMTMTRSPRALVYATRRVLRHLRDLAFHGRGMDLRNGAALVGRLLRSALDLGVTLRPGCAVTDLVVEQGRVMGVTLESGETLRAARGVVLASGGFPHDAARRAGLFPRDAEHRTLAVPSASGDGARLAEGAGGHVDATQARPAAFCPVSTVRWPDGRVAQFPHIIDRGKPGVIGVLSDGERFCNEGLGYHDYVEAMLRTLPDDAPARSWLVCDHRFLRRYGLGVVRPQPVPWRQWTKRGYLRTARSIEGQARQCGIDPAGLARTVTDWNRHAAQGEDPEFHRGTTPYMRLQGDPEQKPNPNVAPIVKPPFHAVEVVPGSFGTFSGIATDGQARALDAQGAPIPGLYAAGTDAATIFGGFYPAGGIALGPALTFGFIAGRHAAEGGA
ncbi:FAD-dependent oxidoreductase [Salipiger mucosus]|uniref:Succinate dehydrogenase/fumarate reductase, flavoprotein subunit n=1 Tax=Salipiger mucosus DSM 16094 TaxID=1123237 RepID=S9Q708_9RHOB|nr:FAD-dependent oxidoreductase [Salipiger mucosus]EPX75822.1 Succinate dehydrogenase/fumarate reductase, flavoprotein subunit [Salipiger mucosus DSM 16094]